MVPDQNAITSSRIDRRQAMKAALGGAAAAAALSAPAIEGFSLAPNFAAAASQCPAGTTVNGGSSLSATRITCGFLQACWGASCCADRNIGTITVNAASPAYNDPTFAVTVGGQVRNNNGSIKVVVAGLDASAPFASCTVSISGTCGSDTFTASNGVTGSNLVTTPTTLSGRIRCSGSGTGSATVTVAATCICS